VIPEGISFPFFFFFSPPKRKKKINHCVMNDFGNACPPFFLPLFHAGKGPSFSLLTRHFVLTLPASFPPFLFTSYTRMIRFQSPPPLPPPAWIRGKVPPFPSFLIGAAFSIKKTTYLPLPLLFFFFFFSLKPTVGSGVLFKSSLFFPLFRFVFTTPIRQSFQ